MRIPRVSVMILAGALILVPATILAATGGQTTTTGALDQQTAGAFSHPIITRNHQWSDIERLSGIVVCAQNEVSVAVSVLTPGVPDVGLRVQMDDQQTLRPGSIRVKSTSTSFTFVGTASPVGGSDLHTIDVQWRQLLEGTTAEIDKASVNIQYESGVNCG